MKKNKRPLKQEGNITVLKDLGLIFDDPEEEKRSNKALRDFLISKGYPAPKIKIKKFFPISLNSTLNIVH